MRWWKYVAVVGITIACTLVYGRFVTSPVPEAVRAFHRHEDRLRQYVDAQPKGAVAGDLKKLGAELQNAGFSSARREGECTIFYYSTWMASIDSVHEIIYSPKGHWGLPNYQRGEFNTLYELQPLGDDGWFYVVHD